MDKLGDPCWHAEWIRRRRPGDVAEMLLIHAQGMGWSELCSLARKRTEAKLDGTDGQPVTIIEFRGPDVLETEECQPVPVFVIEFRDGSIQNVDLGRLVLA